MGGHKIDKSTVDIPEAAKRLGLSRASVFSLVHAGELRLLSFGPVKGMRISESSLDAYETLKLEEAGIVPV
ncbi:MAG: helix-turn-helix domain-containing protein [Desulfohalobiaceae bacterium]|nr:helix-turn-helix domain-containing protein [Desulfohalobiaceae bacterium]